MNILDILKQKGVSCISVKYNKQDIEEFKDIIESNGFKYFIESNGFKYFKNRDNLLGYKSVHLYDDKTAQLLNFGKMSFEEFKVLLNKTKYVWI